MLSSWHPLLLMYVATVGACVGSFLNVVIYRLPAGQSLWRPRSRCPHCATPIAWYDNVPVLSFVLLRARCRHCHEPISARYALVELSMAALSVAFFLRLGPSWDLLVWLPLAAALLAITFLDIDHWWIPDVITFPAMAWALLGAFLPGRLTPAMAALGLLPALLLFLLAWGFKKITGREGLGLGDIKLLALLGLAAGAPQALAILLWASLQGALLGTLLLVLSPRRSSAAERAAEQATEPANEAPPTASDDAWTPPPRALPFGPFIALASFEVVLLPHWFDAWPHRLAALLLS